MREKYFEDLGLDDGLDILEKFKIDIDDILDKKSEDENQENARDDNKKIDNKRGCIYGISHTKK